MTYPRLISRKKKIRSKQKSRPYRAALLVTVGVAGYASANPPASNLLK